MRSALLVAVGAWMVVLAALFAAFQFQGLPESGLPADYLAGVAKAVALALAALSVGLAVLPQAEPDLAGMVIRSALGFAALAVAALALAAVGLLRAAVVWPLVAALVALSYRRLPAAVARLRRMGPLGLTGLEAALAGLGLVAASLLAINCLAPLTANDALVYHLNLPKIYAQASGLVSLPHSVYANMPHYGEMLYALAYCLGGETCAKMLYLIFTLGAALAVYALARKLVGRTPALAAGCFFLVQPLLLDGRTVCNIDVPLTFLFLAAATLLLEAARGASGIRAAVAAGVLAGSMLGMKYTALAPCASLLAVPLVACPGRMKPRALAAAVLVAAAVVLPWAIKNQAAVGNPVYPMLEGTFDGANWDATQEAQLVAWQKGMGAGRDAADYLLLPFRAGLAGRPESDYQRFDGILNPALLMLLPLALLRRTREAATLALMAAAVFVFWALTSQQMRFLLPCLALTAVLGAVGIAGFDRRAGARAARWLTIAAAAVSVFSLVVPDQRGRPLVSEVGDRLGVVLGLEPRQKYLETNIQPVAMFEHINRTLPREERLLLVWENRGYYLDRPYVADSFFEASTVMRLVAGSRDAAETAAAVRALGVNYVVVNHWLAEHFSGRYDGRDVARLGEFITAYLRPVHSVNRVTLYSLSPDGPGPR